MVDATGTSTKSSAYDRYVNYRRFSIAVGAFVLLLLLPIPNSMLDVAVEYGMGPKYTRNLISQELFDRSYNQVEQWQALTVRALEAFVRQGIVNKGTVIKRDKKQLKTGSTPGQLSSVSYWIRPEPHIGSRDPSSKAWRKLAWTRALPYWARGAS